MEFKTILRTLRKENELSAKDVAEKLNFSISMIYEWEHGRSQPNIETLIKLARLFNVTVDYLTGNTDELGQTANDVELTEAEKSLLFLFRNTTDAGRKAISDSAKSIYEALKVLPGITKAN